MVKNYTLKLLRWLRSILFPKDIKNPNIFAAWGKLISENIEGASFIAEARENPRFIKLEQYLLNEEFSVDEIPIVYAGQRYDLRNWHEKVQEPFSLTNLPQHLNQFESQPSVNIVLVKYSCPNKTQSAIAYYVTIPTSSGGELVHIKANVFQANKRIYSLSIDAEQQISKEF
jgi:hypothetical protein